MTKRHGILTNKTIVSRHILPSLARFNSVIQVHRVVGLEAAGRGEGGDLDLDSFIIILTVALSLLVLVTFLFGARRTIRVRNCEGAFCAILLPDRARSLSIAHCGVLMRLGMTASRVERRGRGFERQTSRAMQKARKGIENDELMKR